MILDVSRILEVSLYKLLQCHSLDHNFSETLSQPKHFLDGKPLLVIFTFVKCSCYSIFFGIYDWASWYCISCRAPKVFAMSTQYAKVSIVTPIVKDMLALLVPSSSHHEIALANDLSISDLTKPYL